MKISVLGSVLESTFQIFEQVEDVGGIVLALSALGVAAPDLGLELLIGHPRCPLVPGSHAMLDGQHVVGGQGRVGDLGSSEFVGLLLVAVEEFAVSPEGLESLADLAGAVGLQGILIGLGHLGKGLTDGDVLQPTVTVVEVFIG